MASAFLSLPPPWSFSSDLKANARRFLQRALVISALVHLAAVGVFRAALERFAATEEEVRVEIPHWSDPAIITPITPIDWNRHITTAATSTKGVFEPTPREVPFPAIVPGAGSTDFPGVTADPGPGPSDPNGPNGPPQPPEKTPAFTPVDTPPSPLVAPRPAYPTWAKEAGIEGKVFVRVLVGTDGIPKRAVIVSGPTGLTEGVESAVLRWRFRPGLAKGVPVEVWVLIPISFRLQD